MVTQYPSRGLIYDRNGKLLVYNNALYDLMVTYDQVDPNMDTTLFCSLLGIDKAEFIKRIEKDFKNDKRFEKYKPFEFMKKVSSEKFARLQENMYQFPGFFVSIRNVRGYNTEHAAHILGYTNEVNEKDIAKKEGYKMGDYIGETGLEKIYENYLKGTKGVKYILKDNKGRSQGEYLDGSRDTSAVSGQNLYLTLDIDLQAYAEQLMQGKVGSVVAIEPSTGEIIVLVSSPTYNPKLLSIGENRNKHFGALSTDINKPFINRAIQSSYPPGSTFKPVLGLIALQEGVTQPNRYIGCSGGYSYKGLRVGCHSHVSASNMQEAVAHSCNAYFCQLLRDVVDKYGFTEPGKGLDSLNYYLRQFGLGMPLKTDIGNSNGGLTPGSKYYDALYPKKKGGWRSPTIISLGIGQGEYLFTPLHMANMTAVIANEGYYITPHAVKSFGDSTRMTDEFKEKHKVTINQSFFHYIKDGMEEVILNGTGKIAQLENITICGKTGTSQNPHGKDHSLFVAFAPKINPKIAIAVMVENGGYGATYAAPIASLVIEKYLNDTIASPRKFLEDRMLQSTIIK